MIIEDKKESFLWKANKVFQVIADTVTEAEEVVNKHYPDTTINEIKRIAKVYL